MPSSSRVTQRLLWLLMTLLTSVQYSTDQIIKPTAIALGNFDGIHLGHRDVLNPILNYPDCCPTVVTFEPHPREFFTGQKQKLLTPTAEKISQFKELGVIQVIPLPFDAELACLSAEEFITKILAGDFQSRCISVGQDFCFGYQRQGTIQYLQAIGPKLGIEILVSKLRKQTEKISSSQIRHYLAQGEIKLANQLLGRSYSLTGRVIKGKQIGRTLGFPTANLEISPDKLLPRYGVYLVKLQFGNNQCYGVMNIGTKPTLEGKIESVEVHIFDWYEEIYGQNLKVNLEDFLRPEMRFDSLEQLKAQIAQDVQIARKLIKTSTIQL